MDRPSRRVTFYEEAASSAASVAEDDSAQSLLKDEEILPTMNKKVLFSHHYDKLKTVEQLEKESKYESLDFDFFKNSVFFRHRVLLPQSFHTKSRFLRWFTSFWIGVSMGLVAFCIDFAIRHLQEIKYMWAIDVMVVNWWLAMFFFVLLNMILVSIATYLVAFMEPVAGGSGIPEIKCQLNGVQIDHLIRLKTLVAKSVGVLFSVSGGLPVGKEGPMIHSGAIMGAGWSQGRSVALNINPPVTQYWRALRNDKDKRDFLAVGAAAGVSAAFGAPIGGVLFAIEEGASHWNQMLTFQAFLAAIMATFTLNLLLSGMDVAPPGSPLNIAGWGQMTYSGITDFNSFRQHYGYNIVDIPFFLLVAALGGLLGATFNGINTRLTLWRFKYAPAFRPSRRAAEALLVCACCAFVNFSLPYIFPVCRKIGQGVHKSFLSTTYKQYYCPDGHYNEMAVLSFNALGDAIKHLYHQVPQDLHAKGFEQFSAATLLIYFFFFFWMAVWTYGIAVPSGLFVPSLLGGAIYGRCCGELLLTLGIATDPGAYALVGSAAWLGGMSRMTISLCAIMIESTDGINFAMPLMMTLMVAKWVGDAFNDGLYDIHIDLKHVPIIRWDPPHDSDLLHAIDVMAKPVVTLPPFVQVKDIYRVLSSCQHNGFPVVDKRGDRTQNLKGMILRKELNIILWFRAFSKKKPSHADGTFKRARLSATDFEYFYPRYPLHEEIKVEAQEMEYWVDLTPYLNTSPLTVQEWAQLSRVWSIFRFNGLRHLPVVNYDFDVVGMITRKDLQHHVIAEKLLGRNVVSYRAGPLTYDLSLSVSSGNSDMLRAHTFHRGLATAGTNYIPPQFV